MTRSGIFIFLAVVLSFSACEDSGGLQEPTGIKAGNWQLNLDIGEESIPVRVSISETEKILVTNGAEHIEITEQRITTDSIIFSMPRFDSQFSARIVDDEHLSGTWTNYLKKDYTLPFEGQYIGTDPLSNMSLDQADTFEVWFSPGTEDEYKALGLFQESDKKLYGTFLTETGDYRFLEGVNQGDSMTLSCFDGSHLFLFNAIQSGDSLINGVFYSGKHWQEPWVAVRNESFSLAHPDSLTFNITESSTVQFDAMTLEGDSIYFGPADYMDKVTIIQVFGSWCPNCYDENVFYQELYEDYGKSGLQIIPIAFERSEDHNQNAQSVKKQFERIGISYTPYIGGRASKKLASEKFPMLNKIISFPTSIILDKQGQTRKIHTGFYGPGTGDYYTQYVSQTRSFLESLLEEDYTDSGYLSARD
jgi:thiol-disulfide isomerase/thioredoxin